MRKLLITTLVLAIVLSLSIPLAFANGDNYIKIATDRTTKILMTSQYAEYGKGSEGIIYVDQTSDGMGVNYFDAVRSGDYFVYNIDVVQAGKYTLNMYFGWADATGKYTIILDGTELGTLQNEIASPGWRDWTASSPFELNLTEGKHTLKIINNTGGPNLYAVLITPDGVGLATDLGSSEKLYSDSVGETPRNFLGENLSSISMKFTADKTLETVRIFAPNWNAGEGSDHELEFTLYKWNKDYETTVSGTVLANKVFLQYGDGRWLEMYCGVGAGEYLLVVENNGTGNSGFYVRNASHSKQKVYFDGELDAEKSARMILSYYDAQLEFPQTETENPPTNDMFIVSSILLVFALAVAVMRKRQYQ